MIKRIRSSIKVGLLLLLPFLNINNQPVLGMGNGAAYHSNEQFSSNLPIGFDIINCGFPAILPDTSVDVEANFRQLAPSVNAGSDKDICEDQVASLVGFAQNYNVVSWSGGDGVFSAPYSLITTYTPGTGDKSAGVVELCLTAELSGLTPLSVVDCLILSIYFLPSVNAGIDATTCESQIFETSPALSNSFLSIWITTGDGFFDDDAAEVTYYFPGPSDLAEGQVELCLESCSSLPCITTVSDCMMLYYERVPAVTAPDDFSICKGTNAQLSCTANNIAYLLWTTSGTGTFDDSTILNPVYTPDINDITNGNVGFYITVNGVGGCYFGTEVDSLKLNIVGQTTISGLDAERVLDCRDFDLVNNTVLPLELFPDIENASSILWTTTGDGSFVDATVENPVYHLGALDIWNGGFTMCVEACQGVCSFITSACIDIIVPIQIISIKKSNWQGISSYVDKTSASVPEVMDPVVNELIFIFNREGNYYWPGADSTNQIGNWQPTGYKAKFNSPCCLPIYGYNLIDQSFLINGTSTYLPVLTNVEVNINDLFAGHYADIYLIWDFGGGLWLNPDPIAGTLQKLLPGRAYMLVSKNNTVPYTIEFPDFDPNAFIAADNIPGGDVAINQPWNDVVNTLQPHFILFADDAVNEFQAGDIVGVFNQDGLCLGVSEFKNRESYYNLIAMGDDPLTEIIDGYGSGEYMKFKLYRPETGGTYNVDFVYDPSFPNSDGTFAINGVSNVIKIEMTITSTNDLNVISTIQVFPNPARDVINITSENKIKQVNLIDVTGQMVIGYNNNGNEIQVDVSKYVKGLYFLQIETYDGANITRHVVIE